MDRDEQRRKHTSSLPTSLHDHLYPMPPLRSTMTGGQLTDEPASLSDTEVPAYEDSSSHTTPQPFRSGQYPPSSLSLPPTIVYETGSSAGVGGVASAGRGEVTQSSSSISRQHPVAITSMERSYDPAAEAGRSSEHHDYSHPLYPTPLRSSYARTQQPQASLFTPSPAAPTSSFYPPETFTYPPPPPPSHREQQQQQQPQPQQHASLPQVWQTRDPDTGSAFQRMDFGSFVDPSRQDDWRTVTDEEARGEQPSSSCYPRSRFTGQELQLAQQYWQQQYESTYLDPAVSGRYQTPRPDYRGDHYHFESFQRRPPSVTGQESRLAPSSSRSSLNHLPQQSLYSQNRGRSEHDREAVFTAHLPTFSQERSAPPVQQTTTQAASSYGERLPGLRYSGPTTGEDPLGLQSLSIQPPTLNYPPEQLPALQDDDDGETDHSGEKETIIDRRSEAGETSSSLGLGKRRRATGPESEDADDEDSPRPKKVSKKTQIACNFCRGRKLKCDGQMPTCKNCIKRSIPCSYAPYSRRRGPGKAPKGSKKHAKANLFRASNDFTLAPVGRAGRPRGTIDTLPEYTVTAGTGMTVLNPGPPPDMPGPLGTGESERQQQQFQQRGMQQVVFPVEARWVDPDRTVGMSGSSTSNRREYGMVGNIESDVQIVPPMRQEGEQQVQQQQQQQHRREGHDVYEQRHERPPPDASGIYKFIQEGFPPPPPPPPG